MVTRYPCLIHKDAGSAYGASFPDFPGCVTAADSTAELQELAEAALQFHIDGMVEDGDDVPQPLLVEAAYDRARAEGAVAVMLVPVRMPGRAKRINVTIDEHLLRDIDYAASARGLIRSAFLAEGAKRLLRAE